MVEDANESAAAAVTVTTPSLSEISKIQKQRSKEAVAFEVVAGSYERLLFGLHCTPSGGAVAAGLPPSGAASTAALGVHMEPIFQFPAHLSCVKTAAASANGKWLVTGAADEVIKVWDLRKRKEVGGLLGHEGDITSLTFSEDKYLVSTSADGTLCLFRTKDWSVLRRFKGHKGPVVHASVHPKGRVALTVGRDRCLRMWDLLGRSTGKSSTSTKLGKEAELVRWNTTGDKFGVILDREIRIFNTNMDALHTLASRSRFHDLCFERLQDGKEVLLLACEDGKVRVYDHIATEVDDEGVPNTTLRCFAELAGHSNRVKSMSAVRVSGQHLAITASSDGTIKVFSLGNLSVPTSDEAMADPAQIEAVSTFDTNGARLTCLTAVAVKDDRTTTAAATSVRGEEDSDSEAESERDLEGLEGGEEQDVDAEDPEGLDSDGDEDGEDDQEASDSEGSDEDEAEIEGEGDEWEGIGV